MRRLVLAAAALLVTPAAFAQQGRIASDFEVARIERQLQSSRDFLAQLSARLNFGDVRMTRHERSLARVEYGRALALAATERQRARTDGDMTQYATATSYAALAHAKLGETAEAFELLEESLRVSGDSAKSWNLYSTSMSVLGRNAKAVAGARNAVTIAQRSLEADPTVDHRLDLAVYRHALAAALISEGKRREAETELERVIASLTARELDGLRRNAARAESFEVFSTARGDVAAYVSLFNRANLRLASLYEERGERNLALRTYQRVLDARSDDATALSAMARLAPSHAERARRYEEAFEANPFSPALIRDYRTWLERGGSSEIAEGTTAGARMRRLLALITRGEKRSAREQLAALIASFPANESLFALSRELETPAAAADSLVPSGVPDGPSLRRLVDAFTAERLSAEDRVALDAATFTNGVTFGAALDGPTGQTVFASGAIDGVRFRFAQATAFAGDFDPATPLRLTYRILGATRDGDADVLLLEPVRLEVMR